ncbi:hypothetical protein KUM39_16680 [Streptomyces sp. J2-1]|nr:hypothetical protein [Streptomyces corallincola]MBV2355990.1 hypothetical protein [Streptomyces corallincola]
MLEDFAGRDPFVCCSPYRRAPDSVEPAPTIEHRAGLFHQIDPAEPD